MAYVLQLFGGFRLTGEDGHAISLPDRSRALLAFLAVASSPVPRQALAELLNTDGDEQELRTLLRQTIYLTRKAMADNAVILAQDNGLVLNGSLVKTDVHLFRSAAARRDDRSLSEIVELYRGPFLDGQRSPSSAFEDWLGATRAEFLERVLDAVIGLADADAAAGLYSSALAHARRALALDPLREQAHRQVMRCLAAMNQRSNALRQYEIARRALAAELDVSPEAETEALREAIARGEEPHTSHTGMMVADRIAAKGVVGQARKLMSVGRFSGGRRAIAALSLAILIIGGGIAFWYFDLQSQPSSDLPSIAILRFANVSGDPAQDYLERGVVEVITAMLATHPGIRVVSGSRRLTDGRTASAQQLGHELGAQYLLEGSVQRLADKVHITAQLIDARTGNHLWARQLEEQGSDLVAIQEQIASKIYESLVGFTGAIERQEQLHAWRKSAVSLQEHDYVLRGEQYYFQFTEEAHARARHIWQEGLATFPNSTMLRMSLAAAYRHGVEAGWSKHPDEDLVKAWQMGREAALAAHSSRFEQWLSHWLMAKLAQWCRGDFELSIVEAKAAVKLVPYDATSRADLAELMANAGRTSEAIEWLHEAVRRDPKGPDWYKANLAWAYYLAARYEDARAELQNLSKPRNLLLATVLLRLGNRQDARAAMSDFLKSHSNYTLADEARRPLITSLKRDWLDDLREAGLPD